MKTLKMLIKHRKVLKTFSLPLPFAINTPLWIIQVTRFQGGGVSELMRLWLSRLWCSVWCHIGLEVELNYRFWGEGKTGVVFGSICRTSLEAFVVHLFSPPGVALSLKYHECHHLSWNMLLPQILDKQTNTKKQQQHTHTDNKTKTTTTTT